MNRGWNQFWNATPPLPTSLKRRRAISNLEIPLTLKNFESKEGAEIKEEEEEEKHSSFAIDLKRIKVQFNNNNTSESKEQSCPISEEEKAQDEAQTKKKKKKTRLQPLRKQKKTLK